ncbi:MAG TPA: FliA/WhiG family RNA polymerase sigma factor [Acidobacteriaceae bacterium]|jgi:RNA polymerase sigma factor for flagellar operon FliA
MQSFTYGRQSVPYPAPSQAPAPSAGEACPADREQVLLENLPMVRFVARRIHEKLPQHVQLEDLVSAGILGLMDATAKFDPAKNTQFRTYAQFRIRGAILDSLRDVDWGPRDLRRKGRAIEDAIRALTVRLGRAPVEAEIANELGQTLEEYQKTLSDLKGLEIGSLHAQRNEDSGEEELAYVPGPPGEDPLFLCMRAEMRDRLQGAIEELPENERLVLSLYYYEELTMKEIALVLNVTASRISQIRSSAILHMRAKLEEIAAPVTKTAAAQEKTSE